MTGRDAAGAAAVTVAGPWSVAVATARGTVQLEVAPATIETVAFERCDALPPFEASRPGWLRGARLLRCRAQETTVKDALVPGSLRVHADPDGRTLLREGTDYVADAEWATVGRPPGAAADGGPVWMSYRHGVARLDAVLETPGGRVELRRGAGHPCAPRPPPTEADERVLARIWITPRLDRLRDELLFPVLETAVPEPPDPAPAEAHARLPAAWRALESGGPLRILAWGDSVTDGAYLAEAGAPSGRWQEQFVRRLRERFPRSAIELATVAWGAHNSRHFLEAPAADAAHHYETAVLGARPHLVVTEFVNDTVVTDPAALETLYGRFLADFRRIGAEWILQTPHYVRPDWMGLASAKECDADPRPHVAALRDFAARHGLALADASARWGRLWRQGLPHPTLLLNACNHPDERGLALYADALMRWFPAGAR